MESNEMTKETLKIALEALNDFDYDKRIKAIETIKAALETKNEPFEYWNAVEGWVKLDEVREHFDSVSCGTIYKNGGEGRVPLYTTPQQRTWIGLTDDEVYKIAFALEGEHWRKIADAIETKLKEKNGY